MIDDIGTRQNKPMIKLRFLEIVSISGPSNKGTPTGMRSGKIFRETAVMANGKTLMTKLIAKIHLSLVFTISSRVCRNTYYIHSIRNADNIRCAVAASDPYEFSAVSPAKPNR